MRFLNRPRTTLHPLSMSLFGLINHRTGPALECNDRFIETCFPVRVICLGNMWGIDETAATAGDETAATGGVMYTDEGELEFDEDEMAALEG